jgi:hypothetical protein
MLSGFVWLYYVFPYLSLRWRDSSPARRRLMHRRSDVLMLLRVWVGVWVLGVAVVLSISLLVERPSEGGVTNFGRGKREVSPKDRAGTTGRRRSALQV